MRTSWSRFVVGPCSRARCSADRSVRIASARVGPWAITLATIES